MTTGPPLLPPGRYACDNTAGEPVYVSLGGRLPTGVEFCTVGVRDADTPDTGLITRNDFRELIDVAPHDALNLASVLVNFASMALWRAEDETH